MSLPGWWCWMTHHREGITGHRECGVKKVTVEEVAAQPGVARFRVAGELNDASVASVARLLRPRLQLSGNLMLDLRDLHCADGSVILLFYDLADQLAGRGRLYLLFLQDAVRRLVEAFGMEDQLHNLTVVRHPAGRAHPMPPPAGASPPAGPSLAGPARLLRRPAFPVPPRSTATARPRRIHRLPPRWQPE